MKHPPTPWGRSTARRLLLASLLCVSVTGLTTGELESSTESGTMAAGGLAGEDRTRASGAADLDAEANVAVALAANVDLKATLERALAGAERVRADSHAVLESSHYLAGTARSEVEAGAENVAENAERAQGILRLRILATEDTIAALSASLSSSSDPETSASLAVSSGAEAVAHADVEAVLEASQRIESESARLRATVEAFSASAGETQAELLLGIEVLAQDCRDLVETTADVSANAMIAAQGNAGAASEPSTE